MSACYALGVISHFFPPAMMLALSFAAILVSMVCRFYNLGPPGSLFFIMAASIGAYSPGEVLDVPLKVGLLTMGSLLACLIAFFYSVYILRQRPPGPVLPLPRPTFDFVVFDSVVIGLFVGASLALAQVLQLEKAYWVPVSCLAVMQGMSLRAAWTKQLHRLAGTGSGLLVSLGLLMLPLNNWSIAAVMIVLAFVIETAVVRHYGFAAIFITPMTILLAEASTLGHGSSAALIEARFYDTVLGCLVGFAGAACLHSPRFREVAGSQLRRVGPARARREATPSHTAPHGANDDNFRSARHRAPADPGADGRRTGQRPVHCRLQCGRPRLPARRHAHAANPAQRTRSHTPAHHPAL